MKKVLCSIALSFVGFFAIAQDQITSNKIELSVKYRTNNLSEKTYNSSQYNLGFQFFKPNINESPRLYAVKVPDDCILAKIRITSLKENNAIEQREYSFSKSSNTKLFDYNQNALMGPYMKNGIEDEIKIELIVYQKNSDVEGYTRIPFENSTFLIKLDLKNELLAEIE